MTSLLALLEKCKHLDGYTLFCFLSFMLSFIFWENDIYR